MRYDTKTERLVIGVPPGQTMEFAIEVIADFNRAIDDMFAELQARGEQDLLTDLCPYFGTVWDSARAMAHVLMGQPDSYFAGRRFLEIGCGLAIPSMVALRRGAARVVATDMHPDVPGFLRRNLAANGLGSHPGFDYRHVDWREHGNGIGVLAGLVDFVIASDVLYDKGQASFVAGFIKSAVDNGAKGALVTDPGRPYLEEFESACKGHGLAVNVEVFRIDPADSKRDVFVLSVRE